MIKLQKVTKMYNFEKKENIILEKVSLNIKKGEFAMLVGQSGAGKSTLLNIICTLEKVDKGKVKIADTKINHLSSNQLANFRKENLGFVFQFYNLIPNLTVKENVELVARMTKNSYYTEDILKRTGLEKLMNSFPHQLSGGEQQRVAIARAVVKKPKILLCDEPTGALDNKNSIEVLKLIQELAKDENMTVVMVTHNPKFLPIADKIYELSDGLITNRFKVSKPISAAFLE